MPSRPTSLTILVCWGLATFGLVRRDILPEFLIGPPPSLAAISKAAATDAPTEWLIQIPDPRNKEAMRFVGRATTESRRRSDGGVDLQSVVEFNSGELLKGTPFPVGGGMKLLVESRLRIDAGGSPKQLQASVGEQGIAQPFLEIAGTFEGKELKLRTTGLAPGMNRTLAFPYEPKSMVQNAFTPIDRMPGLQVGQVWESRVVSPFTGQVETVRVEVERQAEIYWDQGLIKTFVVVQKLPPMTARTWVRPDGLVLRQEVPLPFLKLILERQP